MNWSRGGNTGPWIHGTDWKHRPIRSHLGGRRFAARVAIDHQTGFLINVAVAGLFSVLFLWYPNHDKAGCLTERQVLRTGGGVPVVHRCFVSFFPEKSWGPHPKDLR